MNLHLSPALVGERETVSMIKKRKKIPEWPDSTKCYLK